MRIMVTACIVLGLSACTKIGALNKAHTDATSAAKDVPCAVARVLQAKCLSCHGQPTRENAPMSLTTWDALQAPTPSRRDAGVRVHEQIALRIHDMQQPMPPLGRPPLSDDELSTLDIWLGAGAPAGKPCDSSGELPMKDANAAGNGQAGAAGAMKPSMREDAGDTAASDSGQKIQSAAGAGAPQSDAGARSPEVDMSNAPLPMKPDTNPDTAVPPKDGECEWVDVVARADETNAPYRVPANAGDEYHCFVVDRNVDERTQAFAFLPIADANTKGVMQHWVLYSLESLSTRSAVANCDYTPGYRMIAAGAAGTDPWYFPPNVGVDVGRGLFMLEVHYNNAGKPEITDQSGVRACLSNKPRPNVATVSWLGSERFVIPPHSTDYVVANRCKPSSREPIHLLRFFPHMNRLGTRISLRVDHADGTSDVLHNASYTIDLQKTYAIPYVMKPGDSLLATCFFNNPGASTVTLGFGADNEMCNFFVAAYPSLALTNDTPSGWTVSCLGSP